MNREFVLSFLLSMCAVCFGLIAGCQPKADKPVQQSVSSAPGPDSSQTNTQSEEKASVEPPFELEPEFNLLALSQFESFGSEPDTWKEAPEGITCSGKPRGYLYTRTPYKNFTLRLEYRFLRPANLKDDSKFKGNTGFLVYITGEHKLWPTCIEIQGKHVQMAAIKENGGADPITTEDDDTARRQARKSVGQWNLLEIISNEGALTVSLNGTPISRSQAGPLTEGGIGIQSEDHPFEVRNMRVRLD